MAGGILPPPRQPTGSTRVQQPGFCGCMQRMCTTASAYAHLCQELLALLPRLLQPLRLNLRHPAAAGRSIGEQMQADRLSGWCVLHHCAVPEVPLHQSRQRNGCAGQISEEGWLVGPRSC